MVRKMKSKQKPRGRGWKRPQGRSRGLSTNPRPVGTKWFSDTLEINITGTTYSMTIATLFLALQAKGVPAFAMKVRAFRIYSKAGANSLAGPVGFNSYAINNTFGANIVQTSRSDVGTVANVARLAHRYPGSLSSLTLPTTMTAPQQATVLTAFTCPTGAALQVDVSWRALAAAVTQDFDTSGPVDVIDKITKFVGKQTGPSSTIGSLFGATDDGPYHYIGTTDLTNLISLAAAFKSAYKRFSIR